MATLKVCDDHGCTDDARTINVTKRDTTMSYTGDLLGTYDTAGTLRAALVDEYNESVPGRQIDFVVGGGSPLSASTSEAGVASLSYTPLLDAGPYGGTATFAGDAKYESSAAAFTLAITQKATTISYTGATSGGPNKTITLSAALEDATGKPLAGKNVAFLLGAQSASAATDSNGIAVATLKLDQKNGTHALSATYTPDGGDPSRYLGSSTATIFRLQAK